MRKFFIISQNSQWDKWKRFVDMYMEFSYFMYQKIKFSWIFLNFLCANLSIIFLLTSSSLAESHFNTAPIALCIRWSQNRIEIWNLTSFPCRQFLPLKHSSAHSEMINLESFFNFPPDISWADFCRTLSSLEMMKSF